MGYTVLPQVEANKSKLNTLAFLGLGMRQHYQFQSYFFCFKTIFWKGINIKILPPIAKYTKLSENVYVEEIRFLVP